MAESGRPQNGSGGQPARATGRQQNGRSGDTGDRGARRWLRPALTLLISLLVVAGLAWLLANATTRTGTIQALLFAALMGVFPVSYITYVGFGREEAHRERLKNDFRLLGLAREDQLDETVSKLYRVAYNTWQYVAYITLITLVALLIFAGFLRQNSLDQVLLAEGIITPATMQLLFFAFLGAYIFAVQAIVRRYNTLDLQPQVYSSMLVRMLLAVAVVFAGIQLIQAAGGSLVTQEEPAQTAAAETAEGEAEGGAAPTETATAGADAAAWATVLAFVIGLFPSAGLRWLVGLANRTLTLPAVQSSERPLTYLVGMSPWHEARLLELGIDDAQNLATADLRKLLLTTRFDTQTIVHWIDQAILYTKIGPKMDRFRDAHIHTFFEFKEQLDEMARENADDRRQILAVALGLGEADMLARVANDENYPNYAHIVEYYTRMGNVIHERAEEGLTNVLGRVFRFNSVESIEAAEKWLQKHPTDVGMWFALGRARYKQAMVADAQECYRKALALSREPAQRAEAFASLSGIAIDQGRHEEAIAQATAALEQYAYSTVAHNNRGLAYLHSGYTAEALDDFNRALALDERYADAYLNRALVRLELGDNGNAAEDIYHAYLLGDGRDPVLWLSWGEALFPPAGQPLTAPQPASLQETIDKFSEAIRRAGRNGRQTTRLEAYGRRGYAYLLAGRPGPARSDLELVIEEADREQPAQVQVLLKAYINLGLWYANQGRHEIAREYYEKALALDDEAVEAHYNLAISYDRFLEVDAARPHFQAVAALAGRDTMEQQQARRWLRENPAGPTAGNGAEAPAENSGQDGPALTVLPPADAATGDPAAPPA